MALHTVHRRARGLMAAATLLSFAGVAQARYADRWYRMGDDPAQGVTAGPVFNVAGGFTYDSAGATGMGELHDLQALASDTSPVYVNISGSRPIPSITTNNWAIQFDGVDDFLIGERLANPSQSASHISGGENYTGVTDRGYQFWVKTLSLPAAGGFGVMVDDGEEFEVRVLPSGAWSPETRNSAVTATSAIPPVALDTWYHVEQVRPKDVAGGNLTWVNGIAVASQTGDYNLATTTGLVLGANASPDGAGGTVLPPLATSHFNGIIDELEMFVVGGTYGVFDYTKDNGYFTDVFLPSKASAYSYVDTTGPRGGPDGHNDRVWINGDINFDGVRNQADITAFVAGWRSTNAGTVIGAGPPIGDYVTLGKGDLDIDGDTDIDDFMRLRSAFAGVAVAMPTAEQLIGAVPEPGSVGLALVGFTALACIRRRRSAP